MQKKLQQRASCKMEKDVEKILARLNRAVILVEGKKDEAALREAGVSAPILRYGSGPQELARRAAAATDRPLLLFDFDHEGERKTAEMELLLYGENATPDRPLRRAFKHVFGVRTIEQLPFALERLSEGEHNGKDLRRHSKIPHPGKHRGQRNS